MEAVKGEEMTMEAVKERYENLPETEKIKFLLTLLKEVNNSDETSQPGSSEELNVNTLLQNYITRQKRAYDNSLEKNFELSESRKKQRTLDSWLIKRKDSPSKNKINESLCQTKKKDSNNSTVISCASENVSCSSRKLTDNTKDTNCTSLLHNLPNGKEFSEVTNHTINRCEKSKSDFVTASSTESLNPKSTDSVSEKYNLRSRKNFYKSWSVKGSKIKNPEIKNNHVSNNNKDLDSLKKASRKENKNIEWNIAQSGTTETSINESSPLSDNTQIIVNHTESGNDEHMIDKCRGENFTKSGAKGSIMPVISEDLNHQLDVVLSPRNEQVVTTSASLQSNYEAFCKLEAECSQADLSIFEILGNEKIQNLLSDDKLSNEAVVFIGSFQSGTRTLPVVHLLDSQKKLLDGVSELQKIQKQSNSNS